MASPLPRSDLLNRALPHGILALAALAFLYLVTLIGNFADCVVDLSFGELSGFRPQEEIVAECRERAFFPFR